MHAIIILKENDIQKLMKSNLKSFIFKFEDEYQENLTIKQNFNYIRESLECLNKVN